MWVAELSWYSPIACHYGLEHHLVTVLWSPVPEAFAQQKFLVATEKL